MNLDYNFLAIVFCTFSVFLFIEFRKGKTIRKLETQIRMYEREKLANGKYLLEEQVKVLKNQRLFFNNINEKFEDYVGGLDENIRPAFSEEEEMLKVFDGKMDLYWAQFREVEKLRRKYISNIIASHEKTIRRALGSRCIESYLRQPRKIEESTE